MVNTIIGTKKEMSQAFDRLGHRVPVTYIVADSNIIIGLKDQKAILGFGKKKRAKKTENGFVKAIGYAPRLIKEINLDNSYERESEPSQSPQENSHQKLKEINPKDKVSVSIFEIGDLVKITGRTKGKGFAGVVKRWGFAGGPKTHGQSDRHRAPGSIGAGTTPGRVWRGKKMAGHMGASQLTVTNLEVIDVNPEKNILVVKGSIPGPQNSLLIVKKTGKAKVKISQVQNLPKETKEKTQDDEKSQKPAIAQNTEEKAQSTELKSESSNVAKEGGLNGN